jgi:hypothetical protein
MCRKLGAAHAGLVDCLGDGSSRGKLGVHGAHVWPVVGRSSQAPDGVLLSSKVCQQPVRKATTAQE